ncbi:MAG: DUF4214 domain-containing protein [Desulfuromonadales bacterium]|nr:DUF4214 domain-containing protein [Desulfuromonadales bacterium]
MSHLFVSLLLISTVLAGAALAAPIINISPTSIAASTQTDVQVTITGLSPGGSAVLERWVDANRNGYYDAADIRQGFLQITDGTSYPNLNVLGDNDGSANGTIVTSVNYHAFDAVHAPGHYVYRVTSGGLVDDVAFQISTSPTAQSVSGNVAVVGGAAVPGALVFLYSPFLDIEFGCAITDTAGNYQLYIPDDLTGIDTFVAVFYMGDAYYTDVGGLSASLVNIAAGEARTGINLKLYPQGSAVISGYLRDAASSAGIAGIWVDAETMTGGVMASDMTDNTGYYAIHVPPGTYGVTNWPDTAILGSPVGRGYVGLDSYEQEVTVSTSVTGINFLYDKVNVLLKGKVLDLNGAPVPGYMVQAYNYQALGTPYAGAISGADGSFTLGMRAYPGFPDWNVEGSWADDNLVNFRYIADQFTFDPSGGTATKNLIVQPHTAWVQGVAAFNDLTPAVDEWINATRPNGSWNTGADVEMDDGSFAMPLAVGEWVFGNWPNNRCMKAIFIEEGQTAAQISINVNGADYGACDNDLDKDGVLNGTDWWSSSDNCPATPNANQADVDGNDIGNACDTTDFDSDGLADYLEVRAGSNVNNADTDGDGLKDGIDTQPIAYQTPLTDNTAFVRQVYLDFLNREPDVAGLNYWVGELDAGRRTPPQVVEAYLLSAEFGETIAPVARLYFAYFLRIPDYAGLMYWVGEYASGNRTLNDISNFFANSTEFQSTYSSLDNGQFVDLIYTNLFNRAPDPGGRAYWVSELDAGNRTRGEVMTFFSDSSEYKTLMSSEVYVTMTYIGLLRRSPDQGGYDYWVGAMDGGSPGLSLISGFLASQEYQGRFPMPD